MCCPQVLQLGPLAQPVDPSLGCVGPSRQGFSLPRGGRSAPGTASASLASAFYWLRGRERGPGCGSDPASGGLLREVGSPGAPGGRWDGWDSASGSREESRGRARPAVCPGDGATGPALPSHLSPRPCWPCEPPTGPEGLILPQLILPGAQRPLPRTSALMVSRPCCASAAAGGWKIRGVPPALICPQEPWGWTRSHATSSRRGGIVPSMHKGP